MAVLCCHNTTADDVVLRSVEDVLLFRLDNLLSVPGIVVGHGSNLIGQLNLLELIKEAFAGDVVEGGADNVEGTILGLIACYDADACVLHLVYGAEHSQAKAEPVEVLGSGNIEARDISSCL